MYGLLPEVLTDTARYVTGPGDKGVRVRVLL